MSAFKIIKIYEDQDIMILSSQDGKNIIEKYHVFLGIDLIYYNIHVNCIDFDNQNMNDILEISFCKEGRTEYHDNDEFYSIKEGDLILTRTQLISHDTLFPLSYYQGITIHIDLKHIPDCLLKDVDLKPIDIINKYCDQQNIFIIESNDLYKDIFNKIYTAPKEIKKELLKIKVLELLLYLSIMPMKQEQVKEYHQNQIHLAKQINTYLTQHRNEHITIERLSEIFHISKTQLKSVFKDLYGVSIGVYHRTLKMESAAYQLKYTDKTILQIASEHGWDNASKFAHAFRMIKGLSPSEYRKQNRNND